MNYPLDLSFKIISWGPQVRLIDKFGQTSMFIKQKALALKESVRVFADEGQQQVLFEIAADRVIDFNANYSITDSVGRKVGVVRRQGMRSFWKVTYSITDSDGNEVGLIHEENPWTKVADGLLNQIPLVGSVLGLFVNPAYLVKLNNTTVMHLMKKPALLEGKFVLDKRSDISDQEESLLLCSVIMMLLLERKRG